MGSSSSPSSSPPNVLPHIVAICGARRAGKDTAAAHLVSKHGYRLEKIATPLKDMLIGVFDFSPEELETDDKDRIHDKWKCTPREIMQYFGTDVFQFGLQAVVPDIGRSFWARKLVDRIHRERVSCPGARFVISDVRFQHEVDALLEYAKTNDARCMFIRILRHVKHLRQGDDEVGGGGTGMTHDIQTTSSQLSKITEHISETESKRLVPHPMDVLNSGSISELHKKLDAAVTCPECRRNH